MKSLLFSMVFLGSLVASAACPNLTGSYSCSLDGEVWQTQVTEEEVNGVRNYTVRDSEGFVDQYITDNQTKEIIDNSDAEVRTIIHRTSTCNSANALKFVDDIQYISKQNNEQFGEAHLDIVVSGGVNQPMVYRGRLTFNIGGQIDDREISITCVRQ